MSPAPLRTHPYPSVPIRTTRESSSPTSSPAAKLAELLRKAGSLSASPEAVQAMINLGAPADDIVKFTAWMEGNLNGSLQ